MITIDINPVKPVTVPVGAATVNKNANKVQILSIADDCSTKVIASVKVSYSDGGSRIQTLELWKDAAYTAIGDWTQAQANARIIELL